MSSSHLPTTLRQAATGSGRVDLECGLHLKCVDLARVEHLQN